MPGGAARCPPEQHIVCRRSQCKERGFSSLFTRPQLWSLRRHLSATPGLRQLPSHLASQRCPLLRPPHTTAPGSRPALHVHVAPERGQGPGGEAGLLGPRRGEDGASWAWAQQSRSGLRRPPTSSSILQGQERRLQCSGEACNAGRAQPRCFPPLPNRPLFPLHCRSTSAGIWGCRCSAFRVTKQRQLGPTTHRPPSESSGAPGGNGRLSGGCGGSEWAGHHAGGRARAGG